MTAVDTVTCGCHGDAWQQPATCQTCALRREEELRAWLYKARRTLDRVERLRFDLFMQIRSEADEFKPRLAWAAKLIADALEDQ